MTLTTGRIDLYLGNYMLLYITIDLCLKHKDVWTEDHRGNSFSLGMWEGAWEKVTLRRCPVS